MAKISWSCSGDGVEARLDMVEGIKEWDYASSAGFSEVGISGGCVSATKYIL